MEDDVTVWECKLGAHCNVPLPLGEACLQSPSRRVRPTQFKERKSASQWPCTLGTLSPRQCMRHPRGQGSPGGLWARHQVLSWRPWASVAQGNMERGGAEVPECVPVREMTRSHSSYSWPEVSFVMFHPNSDSTLGMVWLAY